MSSEITREIIEIVAGMQAKALAFDSEHPDHPLGKRSAAEYAAAIGRWFRNTIFPFGGVLVEDPRLACDGLA
jgi:hypothetical protein